VPSLPAVPQTYLECRIPHDLRNVRVTGTNDLQSMQRRWERGDAPTVPPPLPGAGSLHGSVFSTADVRGARFEGADIFYTFFNGANLDQSSFERSFLQYVGFEQTMLNQVVFRDSFLNGVSFAGANLTWVRFSGSRYRDINISGAIFCEVFEGGMRWCNDTVDQAFLDAAFYYEGFQPYGLHMLPGNLTVRAPCPVPAAAVQPQPPGHCPTVRKKVTELEPN
jgi:uncharacterized protein YjbI with pentapeptide repeats